MEIRIQRPCIVIKDRPYSDNSLEIDLGEIKVTSSDEYMKGRFIKHPEKIALFKIF